MGCKHNWHFVKMEKVYETRCEMHLAGGRDIFTIHTEYAIFVCEICGLKKSVETQNDGLYPNIL